MINVIQILVDFLHREISGFICHSDFTYLWILEVQKHILRGSEICQFGKIQPSKRTKILKKTKFTSSKCVKMAVFGPP